MINLRQFFINLKSNSFWKSVTALSAGQIISLIINIATIPILSRIYPKDAFGEFAILVSTAGIIIGFVGLGLGSAIMVPRNNDESEDILVSLFIIQTIITTIIVLIFLLLSNHFRIFNISISYFVAIIFLYFYIILTNLSSLMAVYMNKLSQNKVLMFNPIIGAISLILIKIPFGLIGLDYIGLFISTISALLLINIHLLRVKNPFLRRFSFKNTISIFKAYRNFVIFQYPANLLNQLTVQFPNQFIANTFGNTKLADLDMSNRVIQQPLNLIISPIQIVYFRVASEKVKKGEDISKFTYSFIKKALIIGLIPVLLLTLKGEEIFSFVLGVQWSQAGHIASILSLSYLFFFTYGCITYTRVILNKQKSNLISTLINIFVTLILIFTAYRIFGTYISVIYAYSISSVIFNISNIFITLKILRKNHLKFLIISIIYLIIFILLLYIKNFTEIL